MSAIGKEIAWYLSHNGVTLQATKRAGATTQQLVLMNLALYANESGVAWPGREVLAKVTQLSEQSVSDALAALEAQGLIADTRSKKGKGVNVKWRILPGIDIFALGASVDNSLLDVGLARHNEQQDVGRDVGRDVGQVVGQVVGLPRHELELERELKPPREKFAKTPRPLAAQCPEAEKKKRIITEAIAMNFELIEPTRKPGAGLMRLKEKECAAIWAELTSKYERVEGIELDLNNLNESTCALFVAMGLAGENLRPGDIAQMVHH